jgi:mannose-1-phosphate guanylyltransferase
MAKLRTYAVIMAGGQGTRFWPASRRRLPKQFLSILGRRTMLQETVARLSGFCRAADTIVVTGAEHAALVRRQVPKVPPANVLAEPVGRNTAPCIALAAEVILAREEDALMIVLPADHAIGDPAGFRATLRRACAIAAAEETLVTVGVRPTHPETGYGYIEVGRALDGGSPAAFRARAFHEKPDRARAERYCASGRFLWNSGMFVWRAGVIRAAVERHLPGTAAALRSVAAARSRRQFETRLARAYRRVDAISIDHGVMEKAERVAVVEGDFGWNDVGSWDAMPGVWGRDADGNATRGDVLAVEAGNNVVLGGKRLVALLGVDDLVVVDADDALLVCPRSRAQEVRKVVERLRRRRNLL